MGLDALEKTARDVGLGERTGIDLPAETRGLVPTSAYYDQRFHTGKWPRGVLLNLGIGQGELLTTPLQLATMTAVVANRGRAIRPHVVREVEGWDAVHLAMRKVIEGGTANSVRVPGVIVGGKTGTAQNPHGNDHALFVCFAPLDAPTVAMAIVAENSGHGGSISAPIANHVLNRMFHRDSTAAPPKLPKIVSPADTVGD
jgi:penicillin-binding protein 2